MRRLSLVALAVLALVPGGAHATPDNDSQDHPTVIAALPFADVIDFSSATREPLERAGCTDVPMPVGDPTVWYRYVATADDVLLASTHRYFGAQTFPVLRETGDDFETVACGEPSVDDDDYYFAKFQVEAGASYLIRVSGPKEQPDWPFGLTFFHLDRARRNDVGISDLRVDVVDPVSDPVHTAWNRHVTWKTTSPQRWSSEEVAWTAYSCPHGSLIGCSEVAAGRYLYSDGPYGGSCCGWFYWNDHGCVGDVDLRVVLDLVNAADTNAANNSATATTQVIVGDPDVGICPLP
jgi:hypothetical protein